ncbi:MAG: CBS domain-containing protein [Bdellovibrionales bacterium]|nr:CBS domain-containing protein [Bdellovibrionales bacterium]
MSDTVSENAKFAVTKTPHKKSGTDQTVLPLVDEYLNKSFAPLKESMDIFEAAKILQNKKLSGLPIIDAENNLIGFLSEKDVIRHAFAAKYGSLPPGNVGEFMSKRLITVELGTEMFEVLDLFLKNNYQIYPVVHEGKYAGVITRSNALKAVLNMKDLVW